MKIVVHCLDILLYSQNFNEVLFKLFSILQTTHRRTDNNLKRLIKKSLENILDECQRLNLLPSNKNQPVDLKRSALTVNDLLIKNIYSNTIYSRKNSSKSKQTVRYRCKNFLNVLSYAQQKLC